MAPRSPDKPEMQKVGNEAFKAMTGLSKVLDKAIKSAQVVTKNPDDGKIADLGDQMDDLLEGMKAVKVALKKLRGG